MDLYRSYWFDERVITRALLITFFCCASSYATAYRTTQPTPVYASPSSQSAALGNLPKHKQVHSVDEEGAFIKIRSRSGRTLWVQKSHLGPVPESDLYDVEADAQSELPVSEAAFRRLRLDFGAAGGTFSNQSFIEVATGLEYFMMERLSWRNALFYRFNRILSDIYGFDTSARGNGNLPLGALKLRGIIGAGFRFATAGQQAPFAEIGGFAVLKGFELGLMLKYLVPVNSSNPNVAIYSVVFSGSAGFF